jgi:phospholipid/cholesterol/gamma-HCH transport system substrate-binding protein
MIREEDPRFKHLERKIGIFIAIALVGVVVAVVLFGVQKDFFTKKYTLRFTVDRGTGFTKGMSVKLSGFRIGRITSIALNEQAMVDIYIEIDRTYHTWIRSDSTVKLVKEGLVGDNIIDLSVGSPEKPELKDSDAIMYIKTKGLDELADEIAQKVKPVLIEVRDIIGYINNPDGDLKKTIRNIELLTRNLEGTRQKADTLLSSTTGNINLVTAKATTMIDITNKKVDGIDLSPILTRVNSTLDNLDKKVPALLDKADATMENITRISYETRILSEKTFPKIPGIASQVEDVMFSTDRLINSLQNTWILRDSSAPSGRHDFIRGDSYE